MKQVVNTRERHTIRFFFCCSLILASSLILTSTIQAVPIAVEDPPENQLIYKTFGVTDPYTLPVPLPCDPGDENAHCDQDATHYYKPYTSPTGVMGAYGSRNSLTEVTTTGMWPFSPTVKLISHWPSGATSTCSGMLVDAMIVLTAAHCVQTHLPENCPSGVDSCWVDELEAIPAYAEGDAPLGESGYQTILTWTDWTTAQNADYDLAAVQLRYPLGGYIGWLGVGFNTDNSSFLNNTFTSTAYPDTAPFYGERMAGWSGSFTDADTSPEILYFSGAGDAGQMGASFNSDSGIAYGVLSHQDPALGNAVTRITYEKFTAIKTFIEEGLPKGMVDLTAFDVNATPKWNFPNQHLTGFDFYVQNHSDTDLEFGTYTFDVYLSEDTLITATDTFLGTITYEGALPANTGVRLSLSPEDSLVLPEIIHGSQPTGGIFYLGVISTLIDYNSENNSSNYYQPEAIWINDSDNHNYFFTIWFF